MSLFRNFVVVIAAAAAGAALAFIAVFVIYLDARPDLRAWHTTHLDSEYTAASSITTFQQYLALEERLFAELDERIYLATSLRDVRVINRYQRGSISDPARWTPNWNRTFELRRNAPSAGVLLLHGMSDSPYSLRALGQRMHAEGAWVIGLRLPGHGTIPSGLATVRWQDMAASVRIAMRHLREATPGKPLFIVGYSTGGALAVEYALESMDDRAVPPPAGLILISPAIGVSPVAALAIWQARLGRALGLEKLAWSDLRPEYDPFKYGSFAVNAGDQVYRLTHALAAHLESVAKTDKMRRFPPVLVFQSAVDATVSMSAVTSTLLRRLPQHRNELVLFDVNRTAEIEPMLSADPAASIDALLRDVHLPFMVSVVTNENRETRQVTLKRGHGNTVASGGPAETHSWPQGVFSLSHVSLAIPPTDSLYGQGSDEPSPGIRLGNLSPRGERDALQVPAADMLRLRWNPFYALVESNVLRFVFGQGEDELTRATEDRPPPDRILRIPDR